MSKASRRSNEAVTALGELFSNPNVRHPAFFRCSVDGPTEIERVVQAAFDQILGPDEEREEWIRRLRSLGLIPQE